jgi:hypothetical protein
MWEDPDVDRNAVSSPRVPITYLFTCKLNTLKATYKGSSSKGKEAKHTKTKCKNKTIVIIRIISTKFFIIYVPSQQLQGQLQTLHSVDRSNYIMDKHNIKSKTI